MLTKRDSTTESGFDHRAGPWIAFARVFAGLLLLYEATFGGWWKLGNPEWTGGERGAVVTAMGEGAIEDGTYSWFAVVLETVVLPYPELWTVLAVIAQVGAAVALIIGFWTRPAAFITISTSSRFFT